MNDFKSMLKYLRGREGLSQLGKTYFTLSR